MYQTYRGRVVFGDVMAENQIVSAGDGISGARRCWLSCGAGRWATVLAFGLLPVTIVGSLEKTPPRAGSADERHCS